MTESATPHPSEIHQKKLPPGTYYRRLVAIVEPGRVRSGFEDENHRMELVVSHDGTRVTDIRCNQPYLPWNECPGAAQKIRDLIGTPLQRMHVSTGHDAKQHCTHLFDLTRVTIARAAVGVSVQYDVEVPDRIEGRTRSTVRRDGAPVLTWDVEGQTVTGPDPFTGHNLQGAPTWPAGLDSDTLEAALVMRRVLMLSQVREPYATVSRERSPDYSPIEPIRGHRMVGRCFAFQQERAANLRPMQKWRNMSDQREKLLEGFPGVRSIEELESS
jgi:hypothetical protein